MMMVVDRNGIAHSLFGVLIATAWSLVVKYGRNQSITFTAFICLRTHTKARMIALEVLVESFAINGH